MDYDHESDEILSLTKLKSKIILPTMAFNRESKI